jgi:hypothetical protein
MCRAIWGGNGCIILALPRVARKREIRLEGEISVEQYNQWMIPFAQPRAKL